MGCNTSKDAVATAGDPAEIPSPPTASPVFLFDEGDDPAEVEAVTKIQAAFRGHRTRKKLATQTMASAQPTKEELEAEFRPDDKELCHAATKIQASFRGHVARKAATTAKVDELSDKMDQLQSKAEDDEELDIDLSDPDLHKAATKIQATFRGHKVRKDEPKQ